MKLILSSFLLLSLVGCATVPSNEGIMYMTLQSSSGTIRCLFRYELAEIDGQIKATNFKEIKCQ
jgi:hypothetical protein